MKNKIKIENIEIDEISTAEVKKHGNGARIPFYKRHINKKVFIIIPKPKSNIEIDEISTAEVKPHGNGARIPFLKRHIGKKVFVIIAKK